MEVEAKLISERSKIMHYANISVDEDSVEVSKKYL